MLDLILQYIDEQLSNNRSNDNDVSQNEEDPDKYQISLQNFQGTQKQDQTYQNDQVSSILISKYQKEMNILQKEVFHLDNQIDIKRKQIETNRQYFLSKIGLATNKVQKYKLVKKSNSPSLARPSEIIEFEYKKLRSESISALDKCYQNQLQINDIINNQISDFQAQQAPNQSKENENLDIIYLQNQIINKVREQAQQVKQNYEKSMQMLIKNNENNRNYLNQNDFFNKSQEYCKQFNEEISETFDILEMAQKDYLMNKIDLYRLKHTQDMMFKYNQNLQQFSNLNKSQSLTPSEQFEIEEMKTKAQLNEIKKIVEENTKLEVKIENEKLKKIIGQKTGSYYERNKEFEQKHLEYIAQSKQLMQTLKDQVNFAQIIVFLDQYVNQQTIDLIQEIKKILDDNIEIKQWVLKVWNEVCSITAVKNQIVSRQRQTIDQRDDLLFQLNEILNLRMGIDENASSFIVQKKNITQKLKLIIQDRQNLKSQQKQNENILGNQDYLF